MSRYESLCSTDTHQKERIKALFTLGQVIQSLQELLISALYAFFPAGLTANQFTTFPDLIGKCTALQVNSNMYKCENIYEKIYIYI